MLDPDWYYADHKPMDFAEARPTISLPGGWVVVMWGKVEARAGMSSARRIHRSAASSPVRRRRQSLIPRRMTVSSHADWHSRTPGHAEFTALPADLFNRHQRDGAVELHDSALPRPTGRMISHRIAA